MEMEKIGDQIGSNAHILQQTPLEELEKVSNYSMYPLEILDNNILEGLFNEAIIVWNDNQNILDPYILSG